MEFVVKSLREIELLFADIVCDYTNIEQDKSLLQNVEEGQYSFSEKDNVSFVRAEVDADDRGQYKNRQMKFEQTKDKFIFSQYSSRTMEVNFIFYGPDSYENASSLLEASFFQSFQDKLKANNMSLVSESSSGPIRVNENRNGKWFIRNDVKLCLYDLVLSKEEVNKFNQIDIRDVNDLRR